MDLNDGGPKTEAAKSEEPCAAATEHHGALWLFDVWTGRYNILEPHCGGPLHGMQDNGKIDAPIGPPQPEDRR